MAILSNGTSIRDNGRNGAFGMEGWLTDIRGRKHTTNLHPPECPASKTRPWSGSVFYQTRGDHPWGCDEPPGKWFSNCSLAPTTGWVLLLSNLSNSTNSSPDSMLFPFKIHFQSHHRIVVNIPCTHLTCRHDASSNAPGQTGLLKREPPEPPPVSPWRAA